MKPVVRRIIQNYTSAAARNFLARTSGLDGRHVNAYRRLLNDLTKNGLFNPDGTSSVFDALYVFATQNSTTALLNLVSSSFAVTANGSPTFTADQGYTGTDASTTVYLDTGFNPSSASSPKYTQDSAHVSVWNNTNSASTALGGTDLGLFTTATTEVSIFSKYNDNSSYYRINDDGGGASGGIARSDPRGLHVANRSGASAQQANFNSVDQGLTPVSSAAVSNGNIYILARNTVGTGADTGTPHQIMAASIGGGSLTPARAPLLCGPLRRYLVDIAGISY